MLSLGGGLVRPAACEALGANFQLREYASKAKRAKQAAVAAAASAAAAEVGSAPQITSWTRLLDADHCSDAYLVDVVWLAFHSGLTKRRWVNLRRHLNSDC